VIEVPKFGFQMIYKHDKQRVQGYLIVECICHTFGTQIEDQDEDEV
jgi:hypothetical protein